MQIEFATDDFKNGHVSFWMDQIGQPVPRSPLPGSMSADVAIVGAGLTGLWSAYYLKQARPDLDVVVIEREFAGFGASGRNGGWLSAEPAGFFDVYAKRRGEDSAKRLQHHMFGAVAESVRVARAEGFDDDLAFDGLMHAATSPAQMHRLEQKVAALRRQGWGEDDLTLLDADAVRQLVSIDGAVGGYTTPHCARIHPAKFVRGLAAAAERLGVRIFEQTRAERIEPGRVITERGVVSAGLIVRALEGYTADLDGEARTLLPMNSSMIVTEPLTDRQFEQLGWESGMLVGDMAHSFTYMQRTADRRLALGGRGVPYNFASSFDRMGRTAESAIEQLRARMVELFPFLHDARVAHSWSGVLGVPRDWSAAITANRERTVIAAGGYVGHGLAGSNLAGRTVRDIALGERSELVELPWVGHTTRRWEPEPIRWFGANLLYRTYSIADGLEYRAGTASTSPLARISNLVSGRG